MSKKRLVSFVTILLLFCLPFQTAYASSSTLLKTGMQGNSVSELQKDLKTLGYMSITPTGYFGSITKAAVVVFQKKYGLSPDGIAGTKTLGKLDTLTGGTAAKASAGTAADTASARTMAASRGDEDGTSRDIIEFAKRFLGVRYVWGGNTPSGFDCSGYVRYVYAHFGITLNRVSAAQATQGTAVKKEDLLPGDLVFFDTNGGHNKINHAGIYIGAGDFIQSSSGYSKVVISDLTQGFYSGAYMKARRILN